MNGTDPAAQKSDVFLQLKTEFAAMTASSFQAKMGEYVANGTPIVAGTDDFFPELFTALDLPFYFSVRQGLEYGFHIGKGPEVVDGYNEMGGSSSLCSLQKATAYLLLQGMLPKPAAVIMTSTSCEVETILPGWMFFLVHDISETCTRPSTPGSSSTKAP